MILTKRLLSFHPKIASSQSANGMLETLTRLGESKDVLSIWIAGTVQDDNGRTNDLLIVVEEEGDSRRDVGHRR